MVGTRVGARRDGRSERRVKPDAGATTSHKARRHYGDVGWGTIAAATPGLVFPPHPECPEVYDKSQ